MATTPVVETGHCDPNLCNNPDSPTNFITCQGPTCLSTDPNCRYPNGVATCIVGPTSAGRNQMIIPASVPIKQLLKGTGASPWVRLRFQQCNPIETGCTVLRQQQSDASEITTGNISQPYNTEQCRAVIKSFQYGWGGINSGNVCKIVIHDEEGASFRKWFDRLVRNPQGASNPTPNGVYKMRVTFGWLITGSDESCPAQITDQVGGCTSVAPFSTDSRLLCSPPIWFLPTNIVCNLQQGKFVYELEGVDLLMQAGQTPVKAAFGGEAVAGQNINGNGQACKTHFVDACVKLGRMSSPPFTVSFYQLDENSNDPANNKPKRLQFFVAPNQVTANVSHAHLVNETVTGGQPDNNFTTLTAADCPTNWLGDTIGCRSGSAGVEDLRWRGPLGVWDTRGLNPLAAIQSWMGSVLANSTAPGTNTTGIGLTMNYDPVTEIDPANYDKKNPTHGRCIIWANANPNCILENRAFGSRLKALYVVNGGKCSPVLSFAPNIKWNFTAAMSGGGVMGVTTGTTVPGRTNLERTGCAMWGEAPRYDGSTSRVTRDAGQGERDTVVAVGQHLRANYLHNSIEAELKVQGDPSAYYCSPIAGYGRTIALVVNNPYFLDQTIGQDCPQWKQLSGGSSNEILTNRNWFIKGIEHQIKEGSYVTTLKLMLFIAGSDFGGASRNSTMSMLREEDITMGPKGLFSTSPSDPLMQLGADPLGQLTFFCEQGTWSCLDRIVWGGQDITEGDTNTFCDAVCESGDVEVT